jgi:CheY-like chemotaxis protein
VSSTLRALLVEDNEDDAALVLRALRRGGLVVEQHARVETGEEMAAQLAGTNWDVVLADYHLPRFSAADALNVLKNHMAATDKDIPFLVISGTIGEEAAVAMMKAGAADYLLKDHLMRLAPAVEREVRDAGERRERRRAEAALREHKERERVFLRDVMYSVTEGRFRLCDDRSELPPRLGCDQAALPLSPETLQELRLRTEAAEKAACFPEERQGLLMTAAGEAAMNAIVHAGGGTAWVGANGRGTVQVWIEDTGNGINLEQLPRATLQAGFTTAGTMGVGFWLVLQTCDRIFLLTGPAGTIIVLELDRTPPLPPWLAEFA